jgi:sugar phosphate isomerase/epimerase
VNGVSLGVDTRSFRGLPREPGPDEVDTIIRALTACDVRECELFAPQVEPRYGGSHAGHRQSMSMMMTQMMRRELRKWRLRTPLAHFRAIRDKFTRAGITIYAYHYSPDNSFTNEEIDRGFGMAKALGAEILTASPTVESLKRIVPFAEQHQMVVALRGAPSPDAAQECAAAPRVAAAKKPSKYVKVAVDLGYLTACNLDAVEHLREQHAEVAALYVTDRRKNQGERVPWGQGDAPIREVLQLVTREAWPIHALVSYEYPGQGSPVDEVRKGLAYTRQALAHNLQV